MGKTTVQPSQRLPAKLAEGMDTLGLPYDEQLLEKLIGFLRVLNRWNKVFNLTAVRGMEQMVSAHLLDSLAAFPHIRGVDVIDVGTGGGLPGVPLALVSPEKHFVLLDSNAKKTRFVQQAVIELGVTNVTVVHGRVATFESQKKFDTVVTRAFATLADTLAQTRHLMGPGGRLLALKGRFPVDEISALPNRQCRVIAVRVPGIQAQRHLVCWSPPMSLA